MPPITVTTYAPTLLHHIILTGHDEDGGENMSYHCDDDTNAVLLGRRPVFAVPDGVISRRIGSLPILEACHENVANRHRCQPC
jgi:hypothetical protein